MNIKLDSSNKKNSGLSTAPEVVALSGDHPDRLKEKASGLKAYFDHCVTQTELKKAAGETRQDYRPADPFRLLLLIETPDRMAEACENAIQLLARHPESNHFEKNLFYGQNSLPGKLAFSFPGQGSQYLSMGRDIINAFPEAREAIRHADSIFDGATPLSGFIFPGPAPNREKALEQEEKLRSTDIAQPAIGAISLAMLRVLSGFELCPDAACGHSFGELTALHAAGRIDESAFLSLAVARGRYMAEAGGTGDKGGMLAVKAPLNRIEQLLRSTGPELVLANRNSPDQGVVSGPTDAVGKMAAACKKEKIRAIKLPVSAAFHSRLVRDAALPFQKAIAEKKITGSKTPVYSNTTARPYPADPDGGKKLLGEHLACPVNFIEEIENMHRDGIRTFVEVGPRTVLTGLVRSILKGRSFYAIGMDGSSGRRSGLVDLAGALCMLAAIGYPVNMKKWGQP